MSNFIKILDHMEDLLLGSPAIPLTPWVMVNADKLLPLMDRLREHLPQAIQDAQDMMNDQNILIEQARQQAITLLQNAEKEKQHILSEASLMQAIQEEAQRIRSQMIAELNTLKQDTLAECESLRHTAQEEATMIRYSAKTYAAELLGTMETRLGDLHEQVRLGASQLNEERANVPVQQRLLAQQNVANRHPQVSRPLVKRQPRPKVASQQLPLMSQQSSQEEQIEMAMNLIQQGNVRR
jgi:hypothetical protein